MEKLDQVRAKVIEAVPEIKEGGGNHGLPGVLFDRPITLADVLRAIPIGLYFKTLGDQLRFVYDYDEDAPSHVIYWDLTSSLDEQEPEVIEFLYAILLPQQ